MSAGANLIPTISRALDDGTLVELVYDPASHSTAFAVRRPDGSASIEPHLELTSGERLVPYSPRNSLITSACVLLPSDIGDFRDKRDLVREVRAFLHRYVDLEPTFEAIAAHYVLLTWVYDAFSDLGYLRFRGDFGTGKTRALLTLGSLAYKPFFASGASSVSPIFHIQEAFQGTLVLDEADFRFTDATAELTKILNNGTTRGLPVLRTMANQNKELNPRAFRVFGPKLIAMRERFTDAALESRFLTAETSGRKMREDIPIHLPKAFGEEARALRNKLLAWRFVARHTVEPLPSRIPTRVAPRYRQTSLALLSLVDDAELRAQIGAELSSVEARALQDRSETFEAAMLTAIRDAFAASAAPFASIKDVADRFNALAGEQLGRTMTNRWVGEFVRGRLRIATFKTNGVYVIPQIEKTKVDAIAQRFGVAGAA